ncbi:YggT family protein [Alicyclobacillus tolerans]|uniref:YggT family protein n=1 Tax=Alicyclobacillus tolerans TaxID=90970 RepID=UPI001F01970A|nr:YggT family protein [Alicyclobacillus tolerans]MCF8565892.1 YggT family protein [Alicyclobacillus tolerans]
MKDLSNKEIGDESSSSEGNAQLVATRIVWYIAGVVIVLMAFRFVLTLLGANPHTGFYRGIRGVTSPFVAPFSGLFRNISIGDVVRFEPNVLVAMVVYALIAWGIVKLITISQVDR